MKQYFKSRGVEIESNFKQLYFHKPKGKSDQALTIVTLKEIREAYTTLASKEKYQDSMIIYFIYSLSIDPYHIFEIRYENILSQVKFNGGIIKHPHLNQDFFTMNYGVILIFYTKWRKKLTQVIDTQ